MGASLDFCAPRQVSFQNYGLEVGRACLNEILVECIVRMGKCIGIQLVQKSIVEQSDSDSIFCHKHSTTL